MVPWRCCGTENVNCHHYLIWWGQSTHFTVQLFYLTRLWRTFSLPSWAYYIRLVRPDGFAWPASSRILFILLLIRSLLGIALAMESWVPCLYAVVALLVFPDIIVIVLIFSCPVAHLRKCHSFWCGLAHLWILGVLVQDMEGNLTFLGHAIINCYEVVLNTSLKCIVLFSVLPEEYVW